MKRYVLGFIVLLTVLCGGCNNQGRIHDNYNSITHHKTMYKPLNVQESFFSCDGTLSIIRAHSERISFEYERADTPAKRARGLMYRAHMKDTQSMLFIFDSERPRFFYMKNTYIPLDILFLDKEKKIVKMHQYAKPLSCDVLPSECAACYALELCAGSCERNHIMLGDIVLWNT
ncbi:MAG: hypothetical protein US69_C0007G0076 [candidate division TM6 bacterium GW2011_GWF2_38_10]|nr:MAG: hypothetical protein US69_C0007G0076 [candidate division TM6 bacterium GW2011_GWF2_38_10]